MELLRASCTANDEPRCDPRLDRVEGTLRRECASQNLLQKAAARIAKPALIASLATWKEDWRQYQQHAQIAAYRRREAEAGQSVAIAHSQSKRECAELLQKLKVAEDRAAEFEQRLTLWRAMWRKQIRGASKSSQKSGRSAWSTCAA